MALVIGHQVSRTDTSLTIGVAQGTLPGNFASDRFYALLEGTDTEPGRAADVTLTTGGNTQITLTGLTPDRNYWVVGFRHYSDATPTEQATGPAWLGMVAGTDFQTTADTAVYERPAATWTEDWTQGMSRWVNEYGVASPPESRTYPDNGVIGCRYFTASHGGFPGGNGATNNWHSRTMWDPTQPLDATFRVQYTDKFNGIGSIGLGTGEGGYYTIGSWDDASPLQVYAQSGTPFPTHIIDLPDPMPVTPQTWRITFDGTSTWKAYIDGTLRDTWTWTPIGPLHIWFGMKALTKVGTISVTGTPFVYAFMGGIDHGWRWSGNCSQREDTEYPSFYGAQYIGGITAPNVRGEKVTTLGTALGGQVGLTRPNLVTGAWSARSPRMRAIKRLRYAGRQQNGSMTMSVKRAVDDSTIATLTPTGSTLTTYDVPALYQGEDLYVVLNGTVTTASPDGSLLHYLAAEPSNVVARSWALPYSIVSATSVGRSWSLPYTVRNTVGRSWALVWSIAPATVDFVLRRRLTPGGFVTFPLLRRLIVGLLTVRRPFSAPLDATAVSAPLDVAAVTAPLDTASVTAPLDLSAVTAPLDLNVNPED